MSARSVRVQVRLSSGNRCQARVECNGAQAVLFHHRKRAGRIDSFENLLHLCGGCHRWIHANPAKSYSLGLLVHSWADPESIPVASWSRPGALHLQGEPA